MESLLAVYTGTPLLCHPSYISSYTSNWVLTPPCGCLYTIKSGAHTTNWVSLARLPGARAPRAASLDAACPPRGVVFSLQRSPTPTLPSRVHPSQPTLHRGGSGRRGYLKRRCTSSRRHPTPTPQ